MLHLLLLCYLLTVFIKTTNRYPLIKSFSNQQAIGVFLWYSFCTMAADFSIYKDDISIPFLRYVAGGFAAFSVCYFSGIVLFMGDDPAVNGFALMETLLQRPATHVEVMYYVLTVSISFGCFALLAPIASDSIRRFYSSKDSRSF